MTPAEYRSIREKLELKQGELAECLGVSLNTISRRELGLVPITREVELALRWIEAETNGRMKGRRSVKDYVK